MKADDALFLDGVHDGYSMKYPQSNCGAAKFFIDAMLTDITATL
jgi:hypothetical protein